jgi:hypothetical protein
LRKGGRRNVRISLTERPTVEVNGASVDEERPATGPDDPEGRRRGAEKQRPAAFLASARSREISGLADDVAGVAVD